ncbi:MAG: M28 family peptidase [Bacteroidales bacterium]
MKYAIVITILFLSHPLSSQDLIYARLVVDTLSTPSMCGRGYVNDGDKKAARFINDEFENFGLLPFGDSYFQLFTLPMNTYPGEIHVEVDKNPLSPGDQFVILPYSPSVSGTFDLVFAMADSLGNIKFPEGIGNMNVKKKVLVTDINQRDFKVNPNYLFAGYVFLQKDKVWWHVSDGHSVERYFALQILEEAINKKAKTIKIRAKNNFVKNYPTQNVIGYIKGKMNPEQFVVFSAHYDHLGQMGNDIYFPGANDNASGTAMLLNLAHHYSKPENQPECSLAFMAFSAEEAGLLGSGYYVRNPLFPLNQIRFLINLDMVGSGSEGIKVVNGSVFEKEFERLFQLNNDYGYLTDVKTRGKAANSDHYPFFVNGVPSFFIYTLGDESKEYHSIYDTPENVPFTEYEDLFRLLTDFAKTF